MYLLSLEPGQPRGKTQNTIYFLDRASDDFSRVISTPGPRYLKTHLSADFFTKDLRNPAKQIKVIVVRRDPKDALVSYYHFYRNSPAYGHFSGDWDDFFQLFREKRLVHGDYFDFYESWGKEATHPGAKGKVLFISYEEMKDNVMKVVENTAKFLEQHHSGEVLRKVAMNCDFDRMKNEPLCNPSNFLSNDVFFRKGTVGQWRDIFRQEQAVYVDGLQQERLISQGLIST